VSAVKHQDAVLRPGALSASTQASPPVVRIPLVETPVVAEMGYGHGV
jgi:hypothetical protein